MNLLQWALIPIFITIYIYDVLCYLWTNSLIMNYGIFLKSGCKYKELVYSWATGMTCSINQSGLVFLIIIIHSRSKFSFDYEI